MKSYLIHQSTNALILELCLVVPEKEAMKPASKIGIDGRFLTLSKTIFKNFQNLDCNHWKCIDILSHNDYYFERPDDAYYSFYRKRYTFSYERLDKAAQDC